MWKTKENELALRGRPSSVYWTSPHDNVAFNSYWFVRPRALPTGDFSAGDLSTTKALNLTYRLIFHSFDSYHMKEILTDGAGYSSTVLILNGRVDCRRCNCTGCVCATMLTGELVIFGPPVECDCSNCVNTVGIRATALKWDECNSWMHVTCASVTQQLYLALIVFQKDFIKSVCWNSLMLDVLAKNMDRHRHSHPLGYQRKSLRMWCRRLS